MEVNKVLRLFLTTSQTIIIASEYQPTLGGRVSRYQRDRQLLNNKVKLKELTNKHGK
jgi:hypothetical protein